MPYDIEYTQAQKPSWLKDYERVYWNGLRHNAKDVPWGRVKTFTLDINHPYYQATSSGFKYWPGGDAEPEDWDGSEVLVHDGKTVVADKYEWARGANGWYIIGYHPNKPEAAEGEPVAKTQDQITIRRQVKEIRRLRQALVDLAEEINIAGGNYDRAQQALDSMVYDVKRQVRTTLNSTARGPGPMTEDQKYAEAREVGR